MKKLLLGLVLFATTLRAQTPVNIVIGTTPINSNLQKVGIDPSVVTEYGNGQVARNLFMGDGADLNGYYMQTSVPCSNGGTQSTINWFSNASSPSGFPANFFVGANYIAKNSGTLAVTGTGTITASTTNITSGINFTPSVPFSAPCITTNPDVMNIYLRNGNALMSPLNLLSRTGAGLTCPSTTVWNTSDTSPNSLNHIHSLVLPPGCSVTFFADQTQRNATNTNSTLSAQPVNNIDINGPYTWGFRSKCNTSGTCAVSVFLKRANGTSCFVGTGGGCSGIPFIPAFNATPNAGWQDFGSNFTGSETNNGSALRGNLQYTYTNTGTASLLLQDMEVVEGTTLSGGNPTKYRDIFVKTLQKYSPGAIRFMDPGMWPTYVGAMIQPISVNGGALMWANVNNYVPYTLYPTMTYDDMLGLCDFLSVNCIISIGQFNLPSDWTQLATWTSTNAHYISIKNKGLGVWYEHGNEAFNSGAGGALYEGDGNLYASYVGPNFQAFRGATGYDATHMHLVANGWFASGQCKDQFGWCHNVMTVAGTTTNGSPDGIELAPYNGSNLATYTTSGSKLATTGDQWDALNAQIGIFDTTATAPSGNASMKASQTYMHTNFPNKFILDYEQGPGVIFSTSTTQEYVDDYVAGAGEGIALTMHQAWQDKYALINGPKEIFAATEIYNGINCTGSCQANQVSPLWGLTGPAGLACGPGELNTCSANVRGTFIPLAMLNNAFNTLSSINVVNSSVTGTVPSFNYAGGQAGSVGAINNVPRVDCTPYSDGTHAVLACFNTDVVAYTLNFSGAGAPTGASQVTAYPPSGVSIVAHNENYFIGAGSISPVIPYPSTSGGSGSSYVIQPQNFLLLTYTVGGTPIASAPTFSPIAGTYTGTQIITINDSTPGATIFCSTDNITFILCPAPQTVSSSKTLYAYVTASGYTQSPTASAAYVIVAPVAATPTFSPAPNTYTSTQTVTLGDTTPGSAIHYTLDGSTPTSGSMVYTTPLSVATTQTIKAIAIASGFTNSAVATGLYTINLGTVVSVSIGGNVVYSACIGAPVCP